MGKLSGLTLLAALIFATVWESKSFKAGQYPSLPFHEPYRRSHYNVQRLQQSGYNGIYSNAYRRPVRTEFRARRPGMFLAYNRRQASPQRYRSSSALYRPRSYRRIASPTRGHRVSNLIARISCPWTYLRSSQATLVLDKAVTASQGEVPLTLRNITGMGIRYCKLCNVYGCFPARHEVNMTFTLARANNCSWEDKCNCRPVNDDEGIVCTANGTVPYGKTIVTKFVVNCKKESESEQGVAEEVATEDAAEQETSNESEPDEEAAVDQEGVLEKQPTGEGVTSEEEAVEGDGDSLNGNKSTEAPTTDQVEATTEEKEASGNDEVEIVELPEISQTLPVDGKEPEPPAVPLIAVELEADGLVKY